MERLKAEAERLDSKPNCMTVAAAIKELEKIELVRGFDHVYRLDHAVTARRNKVIEIDNQIKKKQEKLFSLKE